MSANVLLIVLPITANNASDKISCFSVDAGDFTGTPLVVSILLCKECVQVNTPERFTGGQTPLRSRCSPQSMSVCLCEGESNMEQQTRLCACNTSYTNKGGLNKLA